MEVSVDDAKVYAYNKQQEGCETYDSEIIFIECNTDSLIAQCCVQEKVNNFKEKFWVTMHLFYLESFEGAE